MLDITAPWWQNLHPFSPPTNILNSLDYSKDSIFNWLNTTASLQLSKNFELQKFKPHNFKLQNFNQLPLNFVAQDSLPPDTAYEQYIAEQGNICTRDNLHDLLNGMIWLNFPKTKAILNQLHFLDIQQNGVPATRSALRHALTLFDENGGVVVSSDIATLQALQTFDWQTALYNNRSQWQDLNTNITPKIQFFPFGHALLEKLVSPRKNICSHALLIHVPEIWFKQTLTEQRFALDKKLTEMLISLTLIEGKLPPDSTSVFNSKAFQPLPVLGIPHFLPNQTLDFYQDKTVFRPPRVGVTARIFNF